MQGVVLPHQKQSPHGLDAILSFQVHVYTIKFKIGIIHIILHLAWKITYLLTYRVRKHSCWAERSATGEASSIPIQAMVMRSLFANWLWYFILMYDFMMMKWNKHRSVHFWQ